MGEKHYGARALYVLAVLCLLYCVGIGLFVAFGSYFFLGLGCDWCFLCRMGMGADPQNRILLDPPMAAYYIPESCDGRDGIASYYRRDDRQSVPCHGAGRCGLCDHTGSQWKTSGPSYVLQKRLDKAIEYLNANPETKVIVSGGQGYNEPSAKPRECKDIWKPPGSIRSGSSWRMLPRIPRRI